jgi:hypothetical protein
LGTRGRLLRRRKEKLSHLSRGRRGSWEQEGVLWMGIVLFKLVLDVLLLSFALQTTLS